MKLILNYIYFILEISIFSELVLNTDRMSRNNGQERANNTLNI